MSSDCNSCQPTPPLKPTCPKKTCDLTPKILSIDNPAEIIIFHKVVVPASLGDDTVVPPENGLYKNVLLEYEANGHVYLYSSDGIPTKVTGPKGEQGSEGPAGQDGQDGRDGAIQYTAGTGIDISENNVISATDTTYSNFTGTDGVSAGTAGLVPGPTTSDTDKYLKSDGTWATVAGGGANITMTNTDPGEGVPLAANNFIGVYQ